MPRIRQAPSPDAKVIARFRSEVMELYKKFEENLVTVSRKYGFEINMWYSPSKIPQPNFRAGRLLLDVDQLYHDRDFEAFLSKRYPALNFTMGSGAYSSGTLIGSDDLLRKNIELRQARPGMSHSLSLFDFKQDGTELRVRKPRTRRGSRL